MSDSDTERLETIKSLEQQLSHAKQENDALHQQIDDLRAECHRLNDELIIHGVRQETFGV